MVMAFPPPAVIGAEVTGRFTQDGHLQLRCPACGHFHPHILPAHVVEQPATGRTEWIDCACLDGEGLPAAHVPFVACPCILRYRVRSTGTNNRYVVAALDYATIEQRRAVHIIPLPPLTADDTTN